MVSVVHCVVCVSEFAVCNCSRVAMAGRIEERPLVKNGEASISSALRRYSALLFIEWIVVMNPSATTARVRSLMIMMRLRSMRSSSTPASGPARIAGTALESRTPVTTSPESACCTASPNTAMLLKWSPISLTTCPIHV